MSRERSDTMNNRQSRIKKGVVSAFFLLLVSGCALILRHWFSVGNDSIIMLYLLGVLFTTISTASIACGVTVSALSLMMFNFFFTEPRYTFIMHSSSDAMMLAFYLITAVITGSVASRLQQQRDRAEQNEKAAQELMRVREEQESIRLSMEREQQRNILLRSVAHDLRSPLTALYGSGSVLTEDYDHLTDAERRSLAGHMTEEILWLTNLVENILNMTRITDSGLALHIEKEAVDDLISEALRHTRPLLRERAFQLSLPEDVIMVPADGKLIVQVMVNLLENAVRHTPATAAVRLSARTENGELRISVADTGDGIRAEHREHIFDRFVLMDNGVIDAKHGLGLGLAICKAIVEAHGGRIWVEDNQPRGAVFCFTLPFEVEA